jgi:MFS family permease
VIMWLGFGIAYAFSAFFQVLQTEFNANRGDVSLIFAISGFLYFSFGAISGPLADRIGARIVATIGMVLIVIGLILASFAQNLWQIYLTYSLSVGFGVGLSYVPVIGTVQRWFVRRRGFASGIATAGIGVGTLVMPPLASMLINMVGWRGTWVVLAILTAIFGVIAALLVESSPQKRGLLPDGDLPSPQMLESSVTHQATPVINDKSSDLKTIMTSGTFWLLYVACLLLGFGLFIPFVHLTPYARDKGLGEVGVVLLGLIGIGSTLGRFVIGGSADKFGRRNTLMAMFSGIALMLAWWLISVDVWSLSIFSVIFGLCYGGFVALIPALAVDYFGGRKAGSLLGILYTSVALGTLLGPTLAGVIFDWSKSYVLPITASIVTTVIAVLLVALTKPPKVKM